MAIKGVIQGTVLARTDHVEALSIEIGGLNEIIVDRLVVKRTIVHQQLWTKWTSLAAGATGGHHNVIKIRDATEKKGRRRVHGLETRSVESRMIDWSLGGAMTVTMKPIAIEATSLQMTSAVRIVRVAVPVAGDENIWRRTTNRPKTTGPVDENTRIIEGVDRLTVTRVGARLVERDTTTTIAIDAGTWIEDVRMIQSQRIRKWKQIETVIESMTKVGIVWVVISVNTTAKEVIIVSIVIMPEGTLVVMKKDKEENLERKEAAMIAVDGENEIVISGTTPERSLLMKKGEGGTVLRKETRNAVRSTKMRESVTEEKTVASTSVNIISVATISLFLQNVDRVFRCNRRTSQVQARIPLHDAYNIELGRHIPWFRQQMGKLAVFAFANRMVLLVAPFIKHPVDSGSVRLCSTLGK
jgi:hypothetical protein